MKTTQRNFRPWPENQKRLELAQSLGLNVSELLNEAFAAKFDDLLKIRKNKLQAALSAVGSN
jgi:hypothetical protein